MAIADTALRILLVGALTFSVTLADESDSSPKETSVKSTRSRIVAPRLVASDPGSREATSRPKRMFFSASGPESQTTGGSLTKSTNEEETVPAAAADGGSQVRSHRMKVRTGSAATASTSREAPTSSAVVQQPVQQAESLIQPALVTWSETEKASDTIQQVSVESSNDFESPFETEDRPEFSFDANAVDTDDFDPEVGEPAIDTVPDFSGDIEADAASEAGDSIAIFDFDEPTEFESAASAADSVHDNASTTVAVPHTEGGGLPSHHTGAQSPQVEVSWVCDGTLNIGQETSCRLVVANTGSSLIRNVVVEAAVPPGIDVVRASPAPQEDSALWSIGDLAGGEEQAVEMVVVARQRGDVALNAFVRFTGYSTSVFSVQEPMLQMAVDGPDTVIVGQQAGYVVTVSNPGTGVAQNVVIEARIPEGLQHRSGSVPRIHVGTLNPGESRQARLNLSAVEGGDFQLAVRTVADGGLEDAALAGVQIAEPRLEVNIEGPDSGAVGKPAEYEIIVNNSGNVPSINVRAKYKLPAGFEFVHADRGGVYQQQDHLVDWFVGTLQPGEAASYRVMLSATEAGTSRHHAGVVSEHTTATMVSHSMEVQGFPELRVNIVGPKDTSVGAETVLEVVVNNEGAVAARKMGLSCELPSGLEFIAAAGPSEYIAENGVVVFRSLGGMDAGGTITYRIKARCVRSGDHRVRVRVASESLSDPVIGERTVSARNGR